MVVGKIGAMIRGSYLILDNLLGAGGGKAGGKDLTSAQPRFENVTSKTMNGGTFNGKRTVFSTELHVMDMRKYTG